MAALEREGKGDLRRVIVRISFLFHFERLPRRLQTRGGGVLPYKTLMGTCGSPGYVFRDFCLKQGIDFIIFCLNQGIDFINFCLKQGIFLNSFVIANGLNKNEFRYLLLSYTGYGFGLNVLNRVSKIGILS